MNINEAKKAAEILKVIDQLEKHYREVSNTIADTLGWYKDQPVILQFNDYDGGNKPVQVFLSIEFTNPLSIYNQYLDAVQQKIEQLKAEIKEI